MGRRPKPRALPARDLRLRHSKCFGELGLAGAGAFEPFGQVSRARGRFHRVDENVFAYTYRPRKDFRKSRMISLTNRVRSALMARGERKRDLTPEQAQALSRVIRASIMPHVKHGGRGLAWLLGVSQPTASRLAGKSTKATPAASMALAQRVSYILGQPLHEVIGLPPELPNHPDEPMRLAMRAAVLNGVPLGNIQRAQEQSAGFYGGNAGADDWFRRFASGYLDDRSEDDTASARAKILKRRTTK